MARLHLISPAFVLLLGAALVRSGSAQADPSDTATKADAEHAVQSYLALWSRDDQINAASVARFYAPNVVYYGRRFSRAQVLADKKAYIQQWPVRTYIEIPGSIVASCNGPRSFCKVSAVMAWRRVGRHNAISTGRARLLFDFALVEGARKIVREAARIL